MNVIINELDITSCVQESTYTVDSEDIVTSYEDADYIKHQTVHRSKVKGSFDLVFIPGYSMSYEDFVLNLNASKSLDGSIPITLDVNNLNEVKTIQAYYKINFTKIKKISDDLTYKRCTFTLEER